MERRTFVKAASLSAASLAVGGQATLAQPKQKPIIIDGMGEIRLEYSMDLIQESRILADRLGIGFNASGLCKPEQSIRTASDEAKPWRKCYRYQRLMYITAWGNVLPCCIAPFATTDYASLIMGNVFESPLAEIWTGEPYTRFRKAHVGPTPPQCCRGCGVLWSL